jgi:hypothetical protein
MLLDSDCCRCPCSKRGKKTRRQVDRVRIYDDMIYVSCLDGESCKACCKRNEAGIFAPADDSDFMRSDLKIPLTYLQVQAYNLIAKCFDNLPSHDRESEILEWVRKQIPPQTKDSNVMKLAVETYRYPAGVEPHFEFPEVDDSDGSIRSSSSSAVT